MLVLTIRTNTRKCTTPSTRKFESHFTFLKCLLWHVTPFSLHPYECTQLPLVYGCAANGTIVTITVAPLEAEGRGAALWWGPEAVAEPCVQETLVTT